jgi:hypothetical protein
LLQQLRQTIQQLFTFTSNSPIPVRLSDCVEAQSPNLPLRVLQVFLIDDDTDLIARMQLDASHWGIHLETANGLTIARQRLQHFTSDAIALDLNFPNTSETGLTRMALPSILNKRIN